MVNGKIIDHKERMMSMKSSVEKLVDADLRKRYQDFEFLKAEDRESIKRILDGPRRAADAQESEEANNSYYNNPLGSG